MKTAKEWADRIGEECGEVFSEAMWKALLRIVGEASMEAWDEGRRQGYSEGMALRQGAKDAAPLLDNSELNLLCQALMAATSAGMSWHKPAGVSGCISLQAHTRSWRFSVSRMHTQEKYALCVVDAKTCRTAVTTGGFLAAPDAGLLPEVFAMTRELCEKLASATIEAMIAELKRMNRQ